MIGGKAVGFDLVSRPQAYAQLNIRLVGSYAMDALLSRHSEIAQASGDAGRAFLKEAAHCEGKAYKSVGHGWDHRFTGPAVVGSALICSEAVIHAAFFRSGEADDTGRISSAGSRRWFRM